MRVFLLISCLFGIVLIVYALKMRMHINVGMATSTELLTEFVHKFKTKTTLINKLKFVNDFIRNYPDDSFKQYVYDLNLNDKQRAILAQVTSDSIYTKSDVNTSFRQEVNRSVAIVQYILKMQSSVFNTVFLILVIACPFLLLGFVCSLNNYVRIYYSWPLLLIGLLSDFCFFVALSLMLLNKERINNQLNQLMKVFDDLFLVNYFTIDEFNNYVVALMTADKELENQKSTENYLIEFKRLVIYNRLLLYLIILTSNVKVSNYKFYNLAYVSTNDVINLKLQLLNNYESDIITLVKCLQDKDLISKFFTENKLKNKTQLVNSLNDNLLRIKNFLFEFLITEINDFIKLNDQINNDLTKKQQEKAVKKQEEQEKIIQYYLNFDRAGKLLAGSKNFEKSN